MLGIIVWKWKPKPQWNASYHPLGWLNKNGQVIKSVDKDIEKLEPSYAGGWTVSYLGKHSGTSSKVKR